MIDRNLGSKPLDKFVEGSLYPKDMPIKDRIKDIQEKNPYNLSWEEAKRQYNRLTSCKVYLNDTFIPRMLKKLPIDDDSSELA